MKKLFYFFLSLCFIPYTIYLTSCHCKKKTVSSENTSTAEVKRDFEKEGYVKATVINYEVDGCAFMLQLEDGKKLEPSGLAADFKKDQLAVWIKYIPKKGGASICMAGQMVDLTDIQLRK